MLQINSEMFAQIMERFDRIERALERMNKLKECLDGDTLLDNYDLCRLCLLYTSPSPRDRG